MKNSWLQVNPYLVTKFPLQEDFAIDSQWEKLWWIFYHTKKILPDLAVDTLPFNILYKLFTSLIQSLIMLDKLAFIIVIIHEHTYTWCTNLLFDWTIFEVIPIVLHNNSWSRIVMMWDWTRYCVFGDTIHYLSCKLCLQLDKGRIEL